MLCVRRNVTMTARSGAILGEVSGWQLVPTIFGANASCEVAPLHPKIMRDGK